MWVGTFSDSVSRENDLLSYAPVFIMSTATRLHHTVNMITCTEHQQGEGGIIT